MNWDQFQSSASALLAWLTLADSDGFTMSELCL